jgi:LysM repeat protein
MVRRIHNLTFGQLAGLLVVIAIFLTACLPGAKPAATPTLPGPYHAGQLTPYIPQPTRINAKVSPISPDSSTATSMPTPTVTPRTHVVKKGEDMGGIAWQYRVSLEALMAANPTVQPNMMSVGTRLVIPPSQTQMPAEANPASGDTNPSTPTPVTVAAGKLSCVSAEDGGVWCFMALRNSQTFPLEGLSAVFRLADQHAQKIPTQMAFLPLDRLEPGTWLPLVAYFPPDQIAPLTSPFQASSEMLTSLPSADDGRYLPTHLENRKIMLAENGLSANLTADILLDYPGEAKRVWVAAVAYDAMGTVVGVRRWEKQDARPLKHGQAFAMTMSVYSVSSEIDRVELFAEARP